MGLVQIVVDDAVDGLANFGGSFCHVGGQTGDGEQQAFDVFHVMELIGQDNQLPLRTVHLEDERPQQACAQRHGQIKGDVVRPQGGKGFQFDAVHEVAFINDQHNQRGNTKQGISGEKEVEPELFGFKKGRIGIQFAKGGLDVGFQLGLRVFAPLAGGILLLHLFQLFYELDKMLYTN